MMRRWPLHLLLLMLLSMGIAALFIREPGFGDDFTYWSFAFDLHERGLNAWQRHSFHDLRWPVWGVSWLLQALFGPGLVSFYGVPLLYVAAGSAIAFTFARLITHSLPASWAAGIAFAFHPLLDTVIYRPMPDLSEGVWGGAALLAWWYMVQADRAWKALPLAFLTGLCVYVAESNRITGVFIVTVLFVATLLYARRRFAWLVVAGVFAALFYAAEMAFYHQLFGDWLHNLHANMGGQGNKGTEPIPVWYLPFRFLDTLWKDNPLAPFYCIFAAVGLFIAWAAPQRGRWSAGTGDEIITAAPGRSQVPPMGRATVLWFALIYLQYACAPQPSWPWRPLVRDADRFLCGLAIPMSVLAVIGAAWLLRLPAIQGNRFTRRALARPLLVGAALVALMAVITSRTWFSLGSIPEMRAYLKSIPSGTKVFTQHGMRSYSYLVAPDQARRFEWLSRNKILHRQPELESLAAQAGEFWYIRKLVWLTTRKALEKGRQDDSQRLATYFENPDDQWVMSRLLAKGDTPDLIFYRRRTPEMPPPLVLSATAPEIGGVVPPLPRDWRKQDAKVVEASWPIPESLRGKLVRVEFEAGSDEVEAFTARLRFKHFKSGDKVLTEYLLKPYLYPEPRKEFFAFQIPRNADRCDIELKLNKGAGAVRFTSFQVVVEPSQ
ncbi:MAG: hypothetical protein ACO1QR_13280 [Chthoniobacteraceae bacterium]